jgi:hypothetical protein
MPEVMAMQPPENILWSADHETGNLSQWNEDQSDAVQNSGTGIVAITDVVARSGSYAIELTITDADGQPQGARIFRWLDNPQEGYYSAWYFFPQKFEPEVWWNVFQFKSKDTASEPMWVLNVGNLENGDMFFYLWDAINEQGHSTQLICQTKTIPVGRWVHVEAFYRRSTDQLGRITVWQDGIKLYDIDNVQTAIADNVHWSLNNYTDQIMPSTATIYADDAIISTTRIGSVKNDSSCHAHYLPIILKQP